MDEMPPAQDSYNVEGCYPEPIPQEGLDFFFDNLAQAINRQPKPASFTKTTMPDGSVQELTTYQNNFHDAAMLQLEDSKMQHELEMQALNNQHAYQIQMMQNDFAMKMNAMQNMFSFAMGQMQQNMIETVRSALSNLQITDTTSKVIANKALALEAPVEDVPIQADIVPAEVKEPLILEVDDSMVKNTEADNPFDNLSHQANDQIFYDASWFDDE